MKKIENLSQQEIDTILINLQNAPIDEVLLKFSLLVNNSPNILQNLTSSIHFHSFSHNKKITDVIENAVLELESGKKNFFGENKVIYGDDKISSFLNSLQLFETLNWLIGGMKL